MKALIRFLKNSKKEFEKVEWPSRKETIRLTGYVISVSFGIGLFVMGIDFLFKQGLNILLNL